MTHRIAINGRFLTRPATGVERVAAEVVISLAAGFSDHFTFDVLMPACDDEAGPREFARNSGLDIRFGRTKGYLWEQLELPVMSRGQTLFSPCNMGPVLKRHHCVTIHDAQVFDAPDSYAPMFRRVYQTLLPMLGKRVVTTVSDHSRSRLAAHKITDDAIVIPNAVDHMGRITPDPVPQGPYVLALGSAAPHKNFAMLADIFATTPDLPRLIVAGGGASVFQGDMQTSGANVEFLGRVSDETLAGLMAGATCFLFPSLTEGFGMPPLEAMWMGCPVIASTAGGVPQACGDAAILLDPTDKAAWTQALHAVLADPDRQADMKAAGLAHAQAYQWPDAAKHYADALTRAGGKT